jgi:hypothetical protein
MFFLYDVIVFCCGTEYFQIDILGTFGTNLSFFGTHPFTFGGKRARHRPMGAAESD